MPERGVATAPTAAGIDLANVDYDDVLHLYRGWRRAEMALKAALAENQTLKARSEKYEGNAKYKDTVRALESLKELTVSLQSQLHLCRQENAFLQDEVKRLTAAQQKMKDAFTSRMEGRGNGGSGSAAGGGGGGMSTSFMAGGAGVGGYGGGASSAAAAAEATAATAEQKAALADAKMAAQDVQSEFDLFRARYQEMEKRFKAMEASYKDLQDAKASSEARCTSLEEVVETMQAENRSLRFKNDAAVTRANACDAELARSAQQLAAMGKELEKAANNKDLLMTAEAEVGVLKGDIARLLRLLEHYPMAHDFLARWHDSDGLAFMGMPLPKDNEAAPPAAGGGGPPPTAPPAPAPFSTLPAALDADDPAHESEHGRHGTADRLRDADITPTEFAALKRLYGGDPFPMTADFNEELDLWVPRKASHTGLLFLVSKIPHAPPKLITEFLRKINKVWNKREARKLALQKSAFEAQIQELRRRVNQRTPYPRVMLDHKVRRLEQQVRSDIVKALTGRPKKAVDALRGGQDYFEEEDDDDALVESATSAHQPRRLCEQEKSKKAEQTAHKRGGGSVVRVSKAKLLEASLMSLETLGRQRRTGVDGSALTDAQAPARSRSSSSLSHSVATDPAHPPALGTPAAGGGPGPGPGAGTASKTAALQEQEHPSEPYLRGALWLGRNLTMVLEETAEGMDNFRTSLLHEISAAAADPDMRRATHRLALLGANGANEALTLVNRSRVRAREMLQNTAGIAAGDATTFREFLRTLPIEASLAQPEHSVLHAAPPKPPKRSGGGPAGGGSVGGSPPGSPARPPPAPRSPGRSGGGAATPRRGGAGPAASRSRGGVTR